MKKSSEDAIGQVLAGLRDAEAPIGMERRILETAQDRASVKSVRLAPWAWCKPSNTSRSAPNSKKR